MEGRLELEWQGREITIERRTRGRVPLGEFRAYETATGIPVPELTAANCGETLTGVEQSVFRRAGFLRLSELPVTQDEALRRRLNALVTTGDESVQTAQLEQKLRDLKNKCRYNRTGLLPQAEEARQTLEQRREELERLTGEGESLRASLSELEQTKQALEKHRDALRFAEARRVAAVTRQAREALELAADRRAALEGMNLDGEAARRNLEELQTIREEWRVLRLERERGEKTRILARRVPEEKLEADARRYTRCKPLPLLLGLAALSAWVAGIALLVWGKGVPGGIAAGLGALLLAGAGCCFVTCRSMEKTYGSRDPEQWRIALREYRRMEVLEERSRSLQKRGAALWGDQNPEEAEQSWRRELELERDLEQARREEERCRAYLTALGEAQPVPEPEGEDPMELTPEQTASALEQTLREQHRLQNLLGQNQGRMELLGSSQGLEEELAQANRRITLLEQTYSALTVALETLTQARQELQRRFSPRITRRAREFLTCLTDGRYDRLIWGEDFTLTAGAEGEDTLRLALWRSDGTVDQLYLALRLAVAEELTSDTPLILDDVLARFDDTRMAAALELLSREAEHRQVILFTCQNREKQYLSRSE